MIGVIKKSPATSINNCCLQLAFLVKLYISYYHANKTKEGYMC